jgi:hypothetical protein
MKTILSLFFLGLFLMQSAGYFILFKAQQFHIRSEMKQRIKACMPEDELVVLKFSISGENHGFQRIKNDEIRFNGRMYDVVREEKHGRENWIYCFYDNKETQLYTRLYEQVRKEMQNTPGNEKQRENNRQWSNNLFFVDHLAYSIPYFFCCKQTTPYLFPVKLWQSSPETPPPWV